MTSFKKNLFITGTPYQFITAFNLCKELYASEEYVNIIYFSRSDNTDYDFTEAVLDFNGEVFRFEIANWPILIKDLRAQNFERFFFFQENSIYNKYLAYFLKNKGTRICLGPDGTKPYGLFNKSHELLSLLKDTLNDYKLLMSKGLKLPDLIWSRYYKYGSFKLLDEVWLQYPELFNSQKNKTKGSIIKMPELSSQNLKLLADVFGFKDTVLLNKQNIILYFNQPFYSNALIEKEFEILSLLANKFPDKRIYVKLHPATNPMVEKRLSYISTIQLIKDKMPAEFYLAKISNSVVLSGWSAAIMHDISSQNNKYLYLFPLYKETNDKVLSQISFVGFPHIQLVENFDDFLQKL